MAESSIEWTEMTWNPTTGCTKLSSGCTNCYAEKMTFRLQAMGMKKYNHGFQVRCHEEELKIPFSWQKPRIIFVNSMSDLFHEEIPLSFIKRVFEVMNNCPQHIFQVLTKRSDILLQYSPLLDWTPNIWMGVTVENNKVVHRVDNLRKTGALVKFLSLEPLLGPLPELGLELIDWVIVGGESGPKARPIKEDWVIDIRDLCQAKQVPFFFKQWGGVKKKVAGSELQGTNYKEFPNKRLFVTEQVVTR
jgi:protein gp37